jgi:hypothetical protein
MQDEKSPEMTPYDAHAATDPFARSVNAFEALTATLSGAPAGGWTHAELEEHLDAAGRDLLRQLLQDHLDLRAHREEDQARTTARPVVLGPEGALRPWCEPGHARWLATVFGLVRVTRVAHRAPAPATSTPPTPRCPCPPAATRRACADSRSPRRCAARSTRPRRR